jgi:hypothetical protein
MRRLLAVLLVVTATGCSLPISSQTTTVGTVQAERRQKDDIQVLPPGPRSGQSPEEVVQAFLGAQASSAGRHAIAREFLTDSAATAWRDDAGVKVFDPDRLTVQRLPGGASDRAVVEITSDNSAEVYPDGSFNAISLRAQREDYVLQRVRGDWRLVTVPAGLRLTSADLFRSFDPMNVYYLAPLTKGFPRHLVPDQVFLPVGVDKATSLVNRLLDPPSADVADVVTSALPRGTGPVSVVTTSAGVVTVNLPAAAAALPGDTREALSAQLVWTLRGLGPSFRTLRLQAAGAPLSVPSQGDVQDARSWADYDPEIGLAASGPYYFVTGRRLRSSAPLPAGPATNGDAPGAGAFAVDDVAVTPGRDRAALLTDAGAGRVTVRTGRLKGSAYQVALTAPGLSSPSWGSGQNGLWMLQSQRRIVLLPPGSRTLRPVTVANLPDGPVISLAVSRDGARAAVVVAGSLYVGTVQLRNGTVSIQSLAPVLPDVSDVHDVAWVSGVELAVIGTYRRGPQVLRASVDGSSVTEVNSAGLVPVSVAAAGTGLVVGSAQGLFVAVAGGFAAAGKGMDPALPG